MRTVIITITILVVIGALGSIGMQQGFFEKSTYTPPELNTNNYVPREVEEPKPSPFVVLAPGSSKIEIYDGIKFDLKTTVVDLSARGFSGSLKAEIRLLTELRELNLSDNTFTDIPAEVGQLSKLEVLNLSNNELTGIPRELGNLQNLKILDVRGNDISEDDLTVITEDLATSTKILVD